MINEVIQTERLILREITENDYEEIANILQDIEIMYAWEKAFSDVEVRSWIEKNINRYAKDGFSYYLAVNKLSNDVVGVMGPLVENIEEKEYIGVAYILNKKYWNKGYATEGIRACIDYAFRTLNTNKVIAQIRPENKASLNVAKRLNMKEEGEYIKIYEGKEMKHLIYSIENINKKY
ncbi:GNAT family N-acetyltransferase [Paraclostridium bifermentans]|uniref:GNAT family N-acetyltransferase n=1 Tax=Paraclostridium bifermentans TaxID=1490 RepID=UPI00359CB677